MSKPRLDRRSRLGLGLLATGAVLTLWLEGNQPQPQLQPRLQVTTEAPPTLQGSTKAPTRLIATEMQEHICHENSMRGDGPSDGICRTMPHEIYEDDHWGRWNCATMGNRICGPLTASQPRELALTG